MNQTWQGGPKTPRAEAITAAGWLRVLLRGGGLLGLLFGGLAILLLGRLIERPLFGPRRPLTPFITQFVCRTAFRILGMGFASSGELMREPGAVVANHSSWLDIFALNARKRIYFVSKSEVAKWPVVGWLARATGTVFIERNPRRAREQTELFTRRLLDGHKLLFFPEGTSSDGMRVLPFKTTLFEAFFTQNLRDTTHIQPVTVLYLAPVGQAAHYYGWWGDMPVGPHLLKILAAHDRGGVHVVYHSPVRVADFSGRKALASHVENVVRQAHAGALGTP